MARRNSVRVRRLPSYYLGGSTVTDPNLTAIPVEDAQYFDSRDLTDEELAGFGLGTAKPKPRPAGRYVSEMDRYIIRGQANLSVDCVGCCPYNYYIAKGHRAPPTRRR